MIEATRDTCEPLTTFAAIDEEVMNVFGKMSERGIRSVAKQNGIVLTTRAGRREALLAELSSKLKERKKGQHGRSKID